MFVFFIEYNMFGLGFYYLHLNFQTSKIAFLRTWVNGTIDNFINSKFTTRINQRIN